MCQIQQEPMDATQWFFLGSRISHYSAAFHIMKVSRKMFKCPNAINKG